MTKSKAGMENKSGPRGPSAPMFFKVSLSDKLAQSLGEKISRGVLKRGAQLPTENELCELHGVSRITVRRALDALQRIGLIERIAGKGTFVSGENKIANWQLDSIQDLVQFIADTRTAIPKILRWEIVKPIAEAKRFLGLSDAKTYMMLAVRFMEKQPIYVVQGYIPLAIGSQIKLEDLHKATPVELYETSLDVPPQRVVEEIRASVANSICADQLGIPVGDPVILRTLEFYGPDGPLQYMREWWHPKYFKRRYELHRR